MPIAVLVIVALVVMWAGLGGYLLYRGRAYYSWVIPAAIALAAWGALTGFAPAAFWTVTGIVALVAVVFGVPAVRRPLVTARIFPMMERILPRISDTEKAALNAGTVWWDGDLFSGNPDWRKLADFQVLPLSEEEQAFLDGPVEELCRLVDDFRTARDGDLTPEAWEFMKRRKFFGMIIPTEHGGLGFSAQAHSRVVVKVASRSTAAAVTVMVPNSLGPAELLLHYGTDAQKAHYLPRLARGEEIPCFALTEPEAGSDAASGRSVGVVARGTYEGRDTLGIRLTWNKRYATLAPVATVIGLSFRLKDPDHLLGNVPDLGITVALVPAKLPGVEIGRRHDPLGVPFLNGPTTGRDVFIPLDAIVGGREMAGQGWRMLMESLAAGRSISLPALSVGGVELAARVTGAYATVREQFGLPIGRFEGIQERLGRIAGLAYLLNATRRLTAGAVDAGEKPSVISALVKAYSTELMRTALNDAMDVTGGAGISRGPRNTLAMAYASLPIGITVEGANILTRSLIVFGQGAIRCHPWVREEIAAVEEHDLARFDHALFKHMGFTLTNGFRAWVLAITWGSPARPAFAGPMAHAFGHLSRMSAAFAFLSDCAMAGLGGTLKRRETISGRMSDALAWMYLGSAALKRWLDEGQPQEDLRFVRWCVDRSLYEIEGAITGVLRNTPVPWMRAIRPIVLPLGRGFRPPSDFVTLRIASELLEGRAGRERLTREIFVPDGNDPGLARLERALAKTLAARPAEAKVQAARRRHDIERGSPTEQVARAFELGILTAEERDQVLLALEARADVVQVDAFPPGYFGHRPVPPRPAPVELAPSVAPPHPSR